MARSNRISPLFAVGFIGFGLIMFLVYGLIRAAVPSDIPAVTAAGYNRIAAAPIGNSAAGALPGYSRQAPVREPSAWELTAVAGGAEYQQGTLDATPPAILVDAPLPINPGWLTVYIDNSGSVSVWAGAWIVCRHLDPTTLAYASIKTDPALAVWMGLAQGPQYEVAQKCVEEAVR